MAESPLLSGGAGWEPFSFPVVLRGSLTPGQGGEVMLRGGAPLPQLLHSPATPLRGGGGGVGRNTCLWSTWEGPNIGSFPSPLFGG